jgi:hypothetical protein
MVKLLSTVVLVALFLSLPCAADPTQDPARCLSAYYGFITKNDFQTAYKMRSQRQRASVSYNKFKEIWSNNDAVVAGEFQVVAKKPSRVQLKLCLLADDRDRVTGASTMQKFTGKVTMVYEAGMWRYDDGTFQPDGPKVPSELVYASKAQPAYRAGRGRSGRTYAGTGSGHWIQKNVDSGSMIILEDGSIWELDPYDKFEAMLWLPISDITVVESSGGSPGYDYLLINTDDGEKAHAKLIGTK